MPRVSVILNCYNQGKYVAEAVESVLDQSYTDFELLAVDNGSTDETPEILKRYEGHPKVRLFLNPDNISITRRFNQAVAEAKGEFISFLYSDDYYLPEKLERQIASFDRLGAEYGVVYGPARKFNELTGRYWNQGSVAASGDVFARLCRDYERGQIDMVSPLTRKSCLVKYPFYEDIFAEGEGIFFRIALAFKFSYHEEPLAVLRDHASNAGKAIRWNAEMTEVTLDRLERHEDLRDVDRPALHAYRLTLQRNHGWQAVRVGGDVRWAREQFARAIGSSWRQVFYPRVMAGLILSFLSEDLRTRVNRFGNRVMRHEYNSLHVQEVGGLAMQSGRPAAAKCL
jgi:glycosyltransferase involved in cell wall biosynthesis